MRVWQSVCSVAHCSYSFRALAHTGRQRSNFLKRPSAATRRAGRVTPPLFVQRTAVATQRRHALYQSSARSSLRGKGWKRVPFPSLLFLRMTCKKTFLSHLINLHPKDQKISGDFFSCLQILQKKTTFFIRILP